MKINKIKVLLIKIIFILIVICYFTSCKYFYDKKKVIKVTKLNDIITYDFNYGNQIFTIGNDTILPVGSWLDDSDVWHLPK